MTAAKFMSDRILSIQHVSKRYSGVPALSDVSLEIIRGEFHAVVGENGAGKSTLMKILAGVITDYEGGLELHGEAVRFGGTREAEAHGVRIIHQELNLVDQLSVSANIFLGREPVRFWGILDDKCMERESKALFGQLECQISPRQPVGDLRVGDQQLVEIAKALAFRADVLIMDEPTSALTEAEVARLFRVITRLKEQGVTILYISHKLDEVFQLSDRITVLRDGCLVQTLEKTATTPREVTHLMVGREIEERSGAHVRQVGEQLLEVRGLSLPRGGQAGRWRLKDLSLSLHSGEVVGIAGLMGAGRTELLECLFGCSPVRPEGKILVRGTPVFFRHPADACKAGIALVTEDRKRLGLFPDLDLASNITLRTLRDYRRMGLIRGSLERQSARETVERMRIKAPSLNAAITSLSGGNQQKGIIGRWLLARPEILLLDDPTRGIDVGAKAEIYSLIDELCRAGMGVIVTSGELPELMTLSDRILVLCEGRLTAELKRSEFSEQRIMEAATSRQPLGIAE